VIPAPPFDANAVEAALDQFRHAQLQVVEETVGSGVPQRPDPEGNGHAFFFGSIRRQHTARLNRRACRTCNDPHANFQCLAASQTGCLLPCTIHIGSPSWRGFSAVGSQHMASAPRRVNASPVSLTLKRRLCKNPEQTADAEPAAFP